MAVVLASGAVSAPPITGAGRDYDALRDALTRGRARPRGDDRAGRGGGVALRRGAGGRGGVAAGRGPHRADDRGVAAGQDRAARRRSQLGADPRRGRTLRRRRGHGPRGHPPGTGVGGGRRPGACLRRERRPSRRDPGPGAHPRRPARGQGHADGCGPATSRARTSTSTRTTAHEALGRQLRGRAGPRVLGVQPVAALRPPARARGDRGLARLRRRPGPGGRRPRRRRGHAGRRTGPGAGRGHSGRPGRRGRRGHPQLGRGTPHRAHRRPRGPGPPGPQPQRAVGHRAAPLDPGRDRRLARGHGRAGAGAGREGHERRGRGHARLHAHARRGADHPGPLHGRATPGAWCATTSGWATRGGA